MTLIELVVLVGLCLTVLLVGTRAGRILGKSLRLCINIMFPARRLHLPEWLDPQIAITEHTIQLEKNRRLLPDLYAPTKKPAKKLPGLLIYVPLATEGKRDRHITNFIRGIAKMGYIVMVPYWPDRPWATIEPTDTDDFLTSLKWLKKQPHVDPDRIGILSISYGTAPVLAAIRKHRLTDEIRYLVSIGGLADLQALGRYAFTGRFNFDTTHGRSRPESYIREIIIRTLKPWVTEKDQRIIKKLLQKPKRTPSTSLLRQLSSTARTLVRFFMSEEPKRIQQLSMRLPVKLRNWLNHLSPIGQPVRIPRELPTLILHSTDDHLVPYTESLKLYQPIINEQKSALVLIDIFKHTVPVGASWANFWRMYLPNLIRLVRFIYRILVLGDQPPQNDSRQATPMVR